MSFLWLESSEDVTVLTLELRTQRWSVIMSRFTVFLVTDLAWAAPWFQLKELWTLRRFGKFSVGREDQDVTEVQMELRAQDSGRVQYYIYCTVLKYSHYHSTLVRASVSEVVREQQKALCPRQTQHRDKRSQGRVPTPSPDPAGAPRTVKVH